MHNAISQKSQRFVRLTPKFRHWNPNWLLSRRGQRRPRERFFFGGEQSSSTTYSTQTQHRQPSTTRIRGRLPSAPWGGVGGPHCARPHREQRRSAWPKAHEQAGCGGWSAASPRPRSEATSSRHHYGRQVARQRNPWGWSAWGCRDVPTACGQPLNSAPSPGSLGLGAGAARSRASAKRAALDGEWSPWG